MTSTRRQLCAIGCASARDAGPPAVENGTVRRMRVQLVAFLAVLPSGLPARQFGSSTRDGRLTKFPYRFPDMTTITYERAPVQLDTRISLKIFS